MMKGPISRTSFRRLLLALFPSILWGVDGVTAISGPHLSSSSSLLPSSSSCSPSASSSSSHPCHVSPHASKLLRSSSSSSLQRAYQPSPSPAFLFSPGSGSFSSSTSRCLHSSRQVPPSSSFSFSQQVSPSIKQRTPSSCFSKASLSSSLSLREKSQGSIRRKKSLDHINPSELTDKRVLVRADLNVPLLIEESKGEETDKTPSSFKVSIANDARIKASLPTLRYLLDHGAKVIVCSHLGRPKKEEDFPKYSLQPVAVRLQELLGPQHKVHMAQSVVGEDLQEIERKMQKGELLLLENVRFEKGETKNDDDLARRLASLADMYVNDAFGTAHRAHASTAGVTKFLYPSVAGFLLDKELQYLNNVISNPARPFAALVGGAKVSSKLGVLESLIDKVDTLVVGGAMAFTFLMARGLKVGASIVEVDQLDAARRLEALAKEKGVKLILPEDIVIADRIANDAKTAVVPADIDIPDGWIGLDNGPKTTQKIIEALQDCKTVLWNGPMGMSEYEPFASGTRDVAKALADLTREKNVTTVVGGGDSVAAIERLGLASSISHVSTGGGASLELLEGKELPGVSALSNEDE
ncbi:phosphoglycerate kinase pgkii [Cystoisospora suis]|uniref:Phosphoglycerate kinase n=1 Tax=Cystoisospora suis TaxID=483139 RepID=A0A2C6KZ92_9APIC|nr:phosphoglycerate kinase pgkii [Cystoisospora suis]